MGQKIYQYYGNNPPIEVTDPQFIGTITAPTIDVDNIIDTANSTGGNGFYLSQDSTGIRWVSFEPSFTEGFFVQDEGNFIPLVGTAQSFTTFNFVQKNSLGIGTDTLIPILDPSNPDFIAQIQTKDFWGHNSIGDIYRMTNVGIGSILPNRALDIVGTLRATGAVDFTNNLNVSGISYVVNVTESNSSGTGALIVSGGAGIGKNLFVGGNLNVTLDTSIGGILNVVGPTNLNSNLNVVGITTLQNQLKVNGISSFYGSSLFYDSVGISKTAILQSSLIVGGATTLSNTLLVEGPTNIRNSLDVDSSTTLKDSLRVLGNVLFDGTLGVAGTTTLQNQLNVSGATNLNSTLNVSNVTTLQNQLNVSGSTNLNNTLGVAGTTTLQNQLNVSGSTNLNNTLSVSGITTLQNQLNVVGITTLQDRLNVGGATTLSDTLRVDGETNLDNNLYVSGFSTFSGITTVITDLNVGRNFHVAGVSTFVGNVTFQGGTINLGDSNTDNVIFTADVNSNIVPNLDNTYDLGSETQKWKKLYVGIASFDDLYVSGVSTFVGITTNLSTIFANQINVAGIATLQDQLNVNGPTDLNNTLNVVGITTLQDQLNVGGPTNLNNTLNVVGVTTLRDQLNVGGPSTFNNTVELNSSLIDINNSTASGKFDYRLSSVGTGVSWRPPGVQTKRAIWVTMDGDDSNSGLLEGDAKRTVGAAASIAQEGDTIFIRSGMYYENNPIGLRTDVSVSGQDLRLVTIIPNNPIKDVFHVRRGCLIENLNFSGASVSIAHTGSGAVAFPPTEVDVIAGVAYSSVSGYVGFGPVLEGSSGRWRSPYVRNCTNFMTKSIGMKINGNYATSLKSMVCDSFTQYNENGIGVSITNNGYAQLVSIFTINNDIAIYCDSGGACDLTNSNSSFGNYGLYAVGLGATEFTGIVSSYPPTRGQLGVDANTDVVTFANLNDDIGDVRRPYDGQSIFFELDLNNYSDTDITGLSTTILQNPLISVKEVKIINGGSGFSPSTPPSIVVRDANDLSQIPKGPQGIIAELSPTIDEITGEITAIDVINSGRNYLPTQNLEVFIDGGDLVGATAEIITEPIYYLVDSSTEPTASGIATVTFTEFIPYELFGNERVSFKRISRILTSGHSFEYVGTGVDINTSTPFEGAVPIKENEVVALDGAIIPFTSTDQKGNFDIGEGLRINQPTSSISGRDFSKSIQAEVTPLILALR